MQRWIFLAINVVGGVAVLGSYAVGIAGHPGETDKLWVEVPTAWRPLYQLNMIPSAIGYLVAFFYIMTRPPEALRIFGTRGYGTLNAIFAAFLIASTLWMPLTWRAIDGSIPVLFWPIQGVLAIAGVCSLAMFAAVLTMEPKSESHSFRLASLFGLGFLALQCAVLDAIIWPRYFSV